jgi:hypothetical protein
MGLVEQRSGPFSSLPLGRRRPGWHLRRQAAAVFAWRRQEDSYCAEGRGTRIDQTGVVVSRTAHAVQGVGFVGLPPPARFLWLAWVCHLAIAGVRA